MAGSSPAMENFGGSWIPDAGIAGEPEPGLPKRAQTDGAANAGPSKRIQDR
jgi:hypothetical protein